MKFCISMDNIIFGEHTLRMFSWFPTDVLSTSIFFLHKQEWCFHPGVQWSMMLWQYTTAILMKIDFNLFTVKTLQEYCKNLDGNTFTRFLTETLQNLKVQNHLSEVFKLTKLILVLPAINATSEKTFSLLKLIKSYLRSTMKQRR